MWFLLFFIYETFKIQIETDVSIKYFLKFQYGTISSFYLNINFYCKKMFQRVN